MLDRITRLAIVLTARAGIALLPPFMLASWARAFTRRGMKRGTRMLERRPAHVRALAAAAAPFARLELDIGGRFVAMEPVPWLTWFRSSIYFGVLRSNDLLDLLTRFSTRVRLRAVVLSGPPVPLVPYAGAAFDASTEILEWLTGRRR